MSIGDGQRQGRQLRAVEASEAVKAGASDGDSSQQVGSKQDTTCGVLQCILEGLRASKYWDLDIKVNVTVPIDLAHMTKNHSK